MLVIPVDQIKQESENHEDETEPLMILALNANESVGWKIMESKVRFAPIGIYVRH